MSTDYGMAAEIRRLLAALVISTLLGYLLGYTFVGVFVGLVLYIALLLSRLHRLNQWLQSPRTHDLPDASALLGDIFNNLTRQRRRDGREKKRLKDVIERINATTAAINDAIIILDEKKLLSWWNRAAVNILRLKSSDVGTSIINYIRRPEFVRYLQQEKFDLPLTVLSPMDTNIRLEFRIIKFGQGESLIIVRDITRLSRLEQMRKDFVANVSHELRTPLTVIRGYLEMLEPNQGDKSQQPAWSKALVNMQQQATRMTTLINDLTMLSKLETDRPPEKAQPVLLKPLLELICQDANVISNNFQENMSREISLQCDNAIALIGDERELHSAFSNLITNAVKYSPEDKPVSIKVWVGANNDCRVSVKDEGVGIEPQHISRLTERFYRVDSSRSIETGGTGLGLAIVKHILLRHDATLTIESEYKNGSTFSCVFPSARVVIKKEQEKASLS